MISSTYGGSQVTLVLGHLTVSSEPPLGTAHTWCIVTYEGKTPIHIKSHSVKVCPTDFGKERMCNVTSHDRESPGSFVPMGSQLETRLKLLPRDLLAPLSGVKWHLPPLVTPVLLVGFLLSINIWTSFPSSASLKASTWYPLSMFLTGR